MTMVSRIVLRLAFFIAMTLPVAAQAVAQAAAQAMAASPWSTGFHSRVRLIGGGAEGERLLAGIEVVLDKGFKTYWRTPGESGLPPRFDWSGSVNAAAIEVKWPAPVRTEDAGGVAYGYKERVTLPVLVKAADPSKPVKLSLGLDYGICKDICIPGHANLNLTLSGENGQQGALAAALASVPKLRPLGQDGSLSILQVEPATGEKPTYTVTIRAPDGTNPTLFAEGPDDWYVSTSANSGHANRFTLTIDEHPKADSGPVPLRLTLTAGDQAIETEVRLDGSLKPR
jgi:DsbC/DsbD-like thiol-disulfide interchange protein